MAIFAAACSLCGRARGDRPRARRGARRAPAARPHAQAAHAGHRQPVRDHRLRPAAQPGRVRAPVALLGRGDRHREARPRHPDLPRGGARGLRRGGRLRRRRHRQRGGQRPGRVRHAADRACPAARPTSGRARSGSPTTWSTPPSTCCAWPTSSGPSGVDLGRAERAATSCSRPGSGSTPRSWSAWTATRCARRAAGAWYYAYAAVDTLHPPLPGAAAARARARPATGRSRASR